MVPGIPYPGIIISTRQSVSLSLQFMSGLEWVGRICQGLDLLLGAGDKICMQWL